MSSNTDELNRIANLKNGHQGKKSGVEGFVMGDANEHPDTVFETKRCPKCGKFYSTDIGNETCIDCMEDCLY